MGSGMPSLGSAAFAIRLMLVVLRCGCVGSGLPDFRWNTAFGQAQCEIVQMTAQALRQSRIGRAHRNTHFPAGFQKANLRRSAVVIRHLHPNVARRRGRRSGRLDDAFRPGRRQRFRRRLVLRALRNVVGGGRTRPEHNIDPAVGFTGLAGIGERVDDARPLGIVHARTEAAADVAAEALCNAYDVAEAATAEAGPLILERLGAAGST